MFTSFSSCLTIIVRITAILSGENRNVFEDMHNGNYDFYFAGARNVNSYLTIFVIDGGTLAAAVPAKDVLSLTTSWSICFTQLTTRSSLASICPRPTAASSNTTALLGTLMVR